MIGGHGGLGSQGTDLLGVTCFATRRLSRHLSEIEIRGRSLKAAEAERADASARRRMEWVCLLTCLNLTLGEASE